MYNQEAVAMAIINLAHKYNGLFHASEKKQNGSIWVSMVFENTDYQTEFNAIVHEKSMCKCMMNGKKGTCISNLLI